MNPALMGPCEGITLVASPWRSLGSPDSDREYVAILSYLPLVRFRAIVRFQRYVGRIRRQLETAPGLVGYSLRATFRRKEFWTLSAWQDEASLLGFVMTAPHREAMSTLRPVMGPSKFVPWRVRGADIPVSWGDALRRTGQAPAE